MLKLAIKIIYFLRSSWYNVLLACPTASGFMEYIPLSRQHFARKLIGFGHP
jgi:hypothetical protein